MNTSAVRVDALAIEVEITEHELRVVQADGRTVSAPLEWFPRLRKASASERANWRLIGKGLGLHWPEIDEDVSIRSLLAMD